ncbi:hypothetical protein AB835_12930 [Candidatus Endobugula sertula]|uniref:HTH araC/xylS-type domain-containing protein n=1 Tax=Candidatus Endobugula sertula TaxID=62101 RepID=A0A1D2QM65_9GAMM|nr:hypothetical protein AB835_12930 [Candidatus Endobugula sertula]
MNRVLVPMMEHMITTSVALPLEMLQAGLTYSRLDSSNKGINIQFCARESRPLTATGGLKLIPDLCFNETGFGDLILVPALWRNPLPVVRKHPDITQWLKEQHQQGATFAVAGTGVVFLAEAGLLDHKPAATHWFYVDKLQKNYPAIDFKPNHLITRAENIYCAGSVNSVADLMVHLIGIVFGESVAHKVEQQFSHEIRRAYKDTYFSDDHATAHQDEAIVELQAWLMDNFCLPEINIDQLCQKSGLNSRTLSRRFKQATGYSPLTFLKQIRLDQARDLLKDSDLGIAEIALQTGYPDSDYFSRLFKRQYQLTPTDFRRSVRGKLFYLND